MNPRNAVLTLAVAAVLLQAVDARAQATNPPYLSQMPSTERVAAEVKGADAMDTTARQMGAFWQLMQIVQELAGQRLYRNQLTPDEGRLLGQYRLGYSTAEQPYAHIPKSPSHPDKAKWFRAHTFYENDPGFRYELLDKFFTEEFRAAYYRATGKPRSSSRPRGDAPAAAAAKPPSTGGPAGRPANTSPSAPAGGSAEAYLAQGNKYLEAKNYAAAVEAYKKSISLQPSVLAYNALAGAYEYLGQHENAIAAYQQAIRLKPDDPVLRLNFGGVYFSMKQYEDALGHFREALRLKPDDPVANHALGRAHMELEQYTEAVAAFQQATRLAPKKAAYHVNLCLTYVEMGRIEEALQVLTALRRLDPASAKELDKEIELLNPPGGGTPESLIDFGITLSLKPSTIPYALRLFRRVILLNRDSNSVAGAYLWIGTAYEIQEKKEKAAAAFRQAAAHYERVLLTKPNDAVTLSNLGSAYVHAGMKQEAQKVYSRLQRLDREKAQKLYDAINKTPSTQPAATGGNTAGANLPSGVAARQPRPTRPTGQPVKTPPRAPAQPSAKAPPAVKIGEYTTPDLSANKAKLDWFAYELKADAAARAYVISYGGRTSRPGDAQKAADNATDYLKNVGGVDYTRLSSSDGGYREQPTVELWIVEGDATPPVATPTVDPKDVKPARRPAAKPGTPPKGKKT